ncbi:MAG: GntR family transcriptional regulator [Clostridiales bacterium]|nr:GntR family transcriptional regulator [Clostridiales bacterium]
MNPVGNPIENQESENKTSKYEKIALDIAYSIVNDEWKMGDIIKGRSTLSGKYSVSPETIRRALKLLEELHVVEVIEKKGMLIKSKTAAVAYIKEYQSKDHVLSLRENIAKMIEEKRVIEDNMLVKLDKLIEEAVLLKNVGIIYPLEFKIPEGSPLIGRSIGDIRFWEHTGATIIGINRTGELVLSPGPKLVFFEGDVVFYVGNSPGNSERVNKFIKSTE